MFFPFPMILTKLWLISEPSFLFPSQEFVSKTPLCSQVHTETCIEINPNEFLPGNCPPRNRFCNLISIKMKIKERARIFVKEAITEWSRMDRYIVKFLHHLKLNFNWNFKICFSPIETYPQKGCNFFTACVRSVLFTSTIAHLLHLERQMASLQEAEEMRILQCQQHHAYTW